MPRFLYTLALYALLPVVPLKLLWRGMKQPDYLKHWGERFGFFTTLVHAPLIWLHCVSVGETHAAAPLVAQLQQRFPQYRILLTHGTPTGRDAGEKLFGDQVMRAYLPYDLPFAVRRFLRHFQPKIGLMMETELWFNLIAACKAQQIPLLLVNARLSEKSASGYARLGGLVQAGLQSLSAVAAQTEADAARLTTLGARDVTVAGNLKFETKPSASAAEQGAQLRALWGKSRPVFLAASTREGEEVLILDAVAQLNIPDLLTVIVPRHPQRFDEVAAILERRNLPYVRKSSQNGIPLQPNIQAVVGDTMGEMAMYYAACDIAFVGGSLLPFGGQNLIEAAMMGKPVVIGPHTFNFAQASKDAVESGAALCVADVAELQQRIAQLLGNTTICARMGAAALQFSQQYSGASARTLELVEKHLH